jgi:membrane-associated protease RseP (regulator of RpoE activity)
MKNIRFLVFGGLLAAGLAATVAGLAASLDSAIIDQAAADKFANEAPVITRVAAGQSLIVQGTFPPERQMMFLDGRGSRLGVMVLDSDAGVRIDQVDRESPAEKAGLREGDIVTEFDGERVRSARQFTRLVQETPDGRSVSIAILRGGQKQTLEAAPQADSFSWSMKMDGIRQEFKDRLDNFQGLKLFEPRAFRYDELFAGRTRGRLGVTVESLTPQLQEYFGAKEGGALVSSVTAGSPAEKAGLKAGDVITTINGDRVQDAGDVIDELNQSTTTEVTIGIVRDRKASTLKATIESRSQVRPRQPAAFVRPA